MSVLWSLVFRKKSFNFFPAIFGVLLPGALQAENFSHDTVRRAAAGLAKLPYVAPLVPGAIAIPYNEYFTIRVDPARVIWKGEDVGFEIHPLPRGYIYNVPVIIDVVDQGTVVRLESGPNLFRHNLSPSMLPSGIDLGISGFRINGPLNSAGKMDEIIVFQGASYFRALSRGQVYGASARGLSINTGRPEGEEFPIFRHFWIEKPKSASEIIVYGLLDSASTTGAYRFAISPGKPTLVKVDASLFPRSALEHVGIAPLTSMFYFSSPRGGVDDFRPEVHDSDGLAIHNGNGEHLWRPLRNPRRTQVSAFVDMDPKGFGLLQRQREFASYQDLEARYDRRPSVWVKPLGRWGPGHVELVEIPTDSEAHDNVVAFWRRASSLAPGQQLNFSYVLSWPDEPTHECLRVRSTSEGAAPAKGRRFVIDYVGKPRFESLPGATVTTTAGELTGPIVQRNSATDGVRVAFIFEPKESETAEFRLALEMSKEECAEVWIYRWSFDKS